MEEKIIHESREGRVAIWTISRPKALNALNSAFFKEFNELLDGLESHQEVAALVITGEGKAFVAGADIAEMQGMGREEALAFSRGGQKSFARLAALPIPVIAAVNGYALGGGCELALACDIRMASNQAIFGMPEARLGLIPGYGGTQRLPRLVGAGNALYMLLSGKNIEAGEALRMGLVQAVYENEEILEQSLKLATGISKLGPNALSTIKELVYKGSEMGLAEAVSLENKRFPELFESDGPEGIQAFLEKRKPQWKS